LDLEWSEVVELVALGDLKSVVDAVLEAGGRCPDVLATGGRIYGV
jgi:hypothetical protein